MNVNYRTILFCTILVVTNLHAATGALIEEERVAEYHQRNHTWPAQYVPSTEGWKHLMDRRFSQISQIQDDGSRYEGFLQAVSSAIVAPNFTENGWGLTRAPQNLVNDLKAAIEEGLPSARLESDVEVIEGSLTPLFIDRPELNARVLKELQPMHEEWAGIELKPSTSYGFRLYRDGSRLNMHVDKPNTHVISSILHIDHSKDSEPWPIVIEDFQGNTNEVILESGDMLFYESSKCFHGRPTTFHGSWYTSIFTHYQPADENWIKIDRTLEAHYAIPPQWSFPPWKTYAEFRKYQMSFGAIQSKLEMIGTSLSEPDCIDKWCGLSNSIKYNGPASFDEVLTTGSTKTLFENEEL